MLRALGPHLPPSCASFTSPSGVPKAGESHGFDEPVSVAPFLSVNLRTGPSPNTGPISISGVNGVISDVRQACYTYSNPRIWDESMNPRRIDPTRAYTQIFTYPPRIRNQKKLEVRNHDFIIQENVHKIKNLERACYTPEKTDSEQASKQQTT